jgi:parvulin-like peptidyl-prolyl isomerase
MRKDEIKLLKISVFFAVIILTSIIGAACYVHYKKYHYINRGRVIAMVGRNKIHEKDIETRLLFLSEKLGKDNIKPEELDKEMLRAILLESYSSHIFLKLAKEKKIDSDNDYKFLAKEYYERLVKEDYIKNYIYNSITDEDIEKKYQELVDIVKDKEERKISHILVKTEEEIIRIRNTILRRNNFERMAEQRSLDKASAMNGGSIGYVIKEELTIPEFADVAFLLKIGELSKPIQTKEGWHILRVDDVRGMMLKSLEDSKNDIYETLKSEKINDFLEKMLQNIEIDILIKTKEETE